MAASEMTDFEHINFKKALPAAYRAMLALEEYVHHSGLEPSLLELVKMRASQINGCAYCLDMHSKDARAVGETEQRLYLLSAWREAPFYTERERAALAWTEAVTLVSEPTSPTRRRNLPGPAFQMRNWLISPWQWSQSTAGTGLR